LHRGPALPRQVAPADLRAHHHRRHPVYWKKGRPYLDSIDYTIIKNLSTANLGFIAGKFDLTFPYALSVPLLKDVNNRMPRAICELTPTAVNRNLIVNRDVPPFDNPDLRRAMALSLDRHAQLKEIYVDGELDTVDSTIWLPKVMRRDYVVSLNLAGSGPDPDQNLYLLYGCGGDLNYNGHCNPEIDKLIDQRSRLSGDGWPVGGRPSAAALVM